MRSMCVYSMSVDLYHILTVRVIKSAINDKAVRLWTTIWIWFYHIFRERRCSWRSILAILSWLRQITHIQRLHSSWHLVIFHLINDYRYSNVMGTIIQDMVSTVAFSYYLSGQLLACEKVLCSANSMFSAAFYSGDVTFTHSPSFYFPLDSSTARL